MPGPVAVVVGGGGPPEVPRGGLGDLGGDVVVVAADSGLAGAALLGLPVDLVVGDMDSVAGGDLAAAVEAGVPVERHPVAKDATDLDLAVTAALARRPRPGRLVVVTGTGDRFDHALGVALALASPRYSGVEVEAWIGPAHLWVVRDRATLRGAPGALVSLLPAHGPAGGVTTDGLLYPLTGEDLPAGSTRGVSNEMTGEEATVRVGSGVLLAVMPGGVGAPTAGVPRSPPWT